MGVVVDVDAGVEGGRKMDVIETIVLPNFGYPREFSDDGGLCCLMVLSRYIREK